MENFFGSMSDKLKALKNLSSIGIDHEQALDIVFESIHENERMQFYQEVFKVAFMYGQLHERNKNSSSYQETDAQALAECIKECTNIIKH
jgi:hypothetical protein